MHVQQSKKKEKGPNVAWKGKVTKYSLAMFMMNFPFFAPVAYGCTAFPNL
jgi:hypothetical protein